MLNNSPGVLLYNGRSYAVGLLWLTVQDENSKKLLGERLKSTHADFYCSRQHISQQQGFGSLAQGHKRGMVVGASMVADQLVGEWHGVFEGDNGWWYVQVRSDTIMPYGDRFFVQEEEAYNVFQEEMTKHNWPHAYAPGKWRLGDSIARELPLKNLLDQLVTTTLVGANMSAVFGGEKQRNVAFMAVAAAMVVMGGLMLKTMLMQPDMTMPAPNPNYVPRTVNAPVLEAPKKDGVEVVLPRQMIKQCGDAAAALMVAIPGWKVQKFNCDLTNASMDWQQITGSLENAKAAGEGLWPKNVAAIFKLRVMTATIPLDKLPTIQQEKLLPQDQALSLLEKELQPMGALQIKPVVPTIPVAPPRGRFDTTPIPPPPPVEMPYLEIQFISGFAPEKFVEQLDEPGLQVQKMTWDIGTATWQYQFKWSYARPGTGVMPAATTTATPGAIPGVVPGAVPGAVTPIRPVTPAPVPSAATTTPVTPPPSPVPGGKTP